MAAILGVSGCAAPDAHIPPFARVPYATFSRESVVALALREWRLFGQPVADAAPGTPPASDDKPERNQGLWQRVGEYWWLGLNADSPESGWTGKHDGHGHVFAPDVDGEYAWSAAFISYVMRMAGAGPAFPYSADHADYINAGARMAKGAARNWLIIAERPELYAPRLGDLICVGRNHSVGLRFDDLPTDRLFPAHCDIVVDTSQPGQISAIGGNVADAVALKHVPVTAEGHLATPDGAVLDPRYPWMAVLRLLPETAPSV